MVGPDMAGMNTNNVYVQCSYIFDIKHLSQYIKKEILWSILNCVIDKKHF